MVSLPPQGMPMSSSLGSCRDEGRCIVICQTPFTCHFFILATMVKNLPAMQRPGFLGQEDPLDKGMATHSSILTWEIPWTDKSGGLRFMGLQRVRHD